MSSELILGSGSVVMRDYRGKKLFECIFAQPVGEWTKIGTVGANRTWRVSLPGYSMIFEGIDRIVWDGPREHMPDIDGGCPVDVMDGLTEE